jgi:hypothetical protein
MPLQIRRGTNAERAAMSVPLVPGELLYTTDSQKIYVGNGSTIGGLLVSGFNENDAKDAAAEMIVNGSHQRISFSYDDESKTLSAVVDTTLDDGPLTADAFVGSVFADDSTLLVDAINGQIVGPVFANVTGNVTGNLEGSVTGDLVGSVFADNSTLLVDAVEGRIVGPVFANVTGSVFSSSSALLVDAANGNIVGPIASAGLAADFDTSGFSIITSDDQDILLTPDIGRRVIVNSNLEITGDINKTGTLNILSTSLTSFGNNPSGIDGNVRILRNTYSSTFGQGFTYAQHHATQEVVPLSLVRTRNTGASPTAVVDGDEIANIEFYGHDGLLIREVASIRAVVDGTVILGNIPGRIEFRTANGGSTVAAIIDSTNKFKVDVIEGLTTSKTSIVGNLEGNVVGSIFADDSTIIIDGTEGGKVTAPSVTISDFLQLPVFADDTARLAAIPSPAKGMVIIMEAGITPLATNQIQFYNGTNWVSL